ncbi:MAG: ATP/GTP-binding protein [Candidatus Hecatellaceae archaeon]
MPVQILFMGTAGSGKTSLVASFKDWLERAGFKVACVNLDPGCEMLPYQARLDVRSWITSRRIMEEEGLGPNGAMVRAMERLMELEREILSRVSMLEADYLLFDTPGQAEIFLFRSSGVKLVSSLKKLNPTIGVYLVDSELAVRGVVGLTASLLLGLASQLWVGLEGFLAFSKADLIKDLNIEMVLAEPEKFKG